jgi:hypothetical protein
MKINDNFETGLARPVDCGVEVWSCACGVRAPWLYVAEEASISNNCVLVLYEPYLQ